MGEPIKPHPIHGYSTVSNSQIKSQGMIERDKIEDADKAQAVKDLINPPKVSGMFGKIKGIFKK